MSRLIQQPINQVKLTNVAVVKLQLQGKRFEIACYRNKILDYRSGHETDLSEVLQSDRVFTNVSKGQFANAQDLLKVFETTDQEAISKLILNHPKSIIQVSDKERELQQADCLARIATWTADHCVNASTQRPFTVAQIQQALSGYNVQPHKPLKKQYLDAFKYLKQQNHLDIERAKMEVLLTCASEQQDSIMDALRAMEPPPITLMVDRQASNSSSSSALFVTRLQVDPSLYRSLDQLAQSTKGGRLEIVHQQVSANVSGMSTGDVTNSLLQDESNSIAKASSVASDKATTNRSSTSSRNDYQVNAAQQKMASMSMEKAADNLSSDDIEEEDSSDEDELLVPMSRKQQRQQQKKQSRLAKRQEQSASDDDDEEGEQQTATEDQSAANSGATVKSLPAVESDPNAKSCNTCGGSFPNATAYRTHFKSDWHRYNQKLKLLGQLPISKEEFEMVDADAFFSENV